jgi:hypothetical protein
MQFIQFPWRWMLVLNLALCFVGMLALSTARSKWTWAALIICFFGLTIRDVTRHATWGRRAVAEMYWSTAADGYRGAKEYLPHEVHLAPIPYDLPAVPLADLRCEIPCAPDAVKVASWTEEEKRVHVNSAVPSWLVLKLYEYPAWEIRVDGTTKYYDTSYSGQINVELSPGRHDINVVFTRTVDRTAGMIISLISVVVLVLFAYFTGSRRVNASNDRLEQAIS